MKVLKFVFIAIVFFFLGYVVGNLFPSGIISQIGPFIGISGTIEGDVELKVTVLDDKKNPVSNLEVDLDKKVPPSPFTFLAVDTDENGVATFFLKPGTYYVFFNANNFPKEFQIPRTQTVNVRSGQENELTIILKRK